MSHTFSKNQNDDDLFLDVQLDAEEIFPDDYDLESDFTLDEKSPSSIPFSPKSHPRDAWKNTFDWINITKQRLNIINKRQESHHIGQENKKQNQVDNSLFFNLEPIKTKTMAMVITLGMLPLLLTSGLTYYFGNQAIKKQEFYSKEHNFELLEQNLKSQKRTLLFLLTATEITALLVGVVGAWWIQCTLNKITRVASQSTNLAIKAENTEQTQILAKIVVSMRQSINSKDIMENAVIETSKILECDRVIIYQFGEQDNSKVLAEFVNPQFCEIALTYTKDLGLENNYLTEYQQKRCQVINNIYQESQLDSQHLSQYESFEIKSCLHLPLEQEGEVIGLLIAYQCNDFRSWKPAEIELCNQIAIEIGLALDDAQMVTDSLSLQVQLQETILWQDYLADSVELIHSLVTEEELIKIAVEETRRVIQCDRAVFYRLDDLNQATIIAESVVAGYSHILGTVLEEPCFETEYYQQPVHVIHDVEQASISPSYQEQLTNLEVKSLMVAPIFRQNQLYGFLIAHQCSVQRFWQEFESKWLQQFAQQIGYSLDNAQLRIQTKALVQESHNIVLTKSEKNAIIQSKLPIFLEESKVSLEDFSHKVLAELDAVTPIFKQMQIMAKSVDGLTQNINQTKLQSQQVDGILRVEHKNIDLTEDRLIDIQQSLRNIAVKNINLGQSCQQFIQATEQVNKLAEQINQRIDKTNVDADRIGIVSEKSLQELTQIVYASTKQLITKTEAIKTFLREIKAETTQITNNLEKSESKAFVSIEIAQETRQNLNQISTRNQEINQLIERITVSARIGEQNSKLAQKSLLEVADLANQAAKKSLTAVQTIASLTEFLEEM